MMLPRPPEMIKKQAATPKGWRTMRRTRAKATARTMQLVTATSTQRIPEKLDQAAP